MSIQTLYNAIIRTVLEGKTNPIIIARHISEYAQRTGVRYDDAREAIRQACIEQVNKSLI